ncbi:putative pentatricopeptide repeat-containing protein At5g59200, chloroplastic [Punica granatum]|uniref:Uncharacterized protein n=2 Tax=Punica granatum TaxID=22663 RepID=A0A2I0IL14_PUNGR|nr:putative pentatricopeptide repeat-containing protein At5g59200, chloroplastic [Punica granatum]PKI44443.1 hypothetical protein CRG98_035175 [Punica granatum]
MPSLSSRRRWRCLKLLETSKTLKQLKQSHSLLIASGLGRSPFALSRLLAFYSSLDRHSVDYAWAVFSRVERPTTACIYNTMLHALLLHDRPAAAIHVYSRMLADAVRPDHYTLPCILKACAKLIPRSLGESVHGQGIKLGLVSNLFVGNALIAFYIALNGEQAAPGKVFDEMPDRDAVSWTLAISGSAKAGDVEAARALFDKAPVKDLGVWGAMISGYVQDNCFKEGLHLFQLMQLEVPYIEPDEALLVSVLCACAHLGTLETGVWIHRLVERRRLRPTTRLWTGLIDMYAKCGFLGLAKRLFDEMPQRDTICWNAMISGFAMNGVGGAALRLFCDMEKEGIVPDNVTLIAVLIACSYSGMACEGLRILQRLLRDYNIELQSELYGCLVELFGRAGLLEEAKEILLLRDSSKNNNGSPEDDAVAWRALLNACCSHGDIKLAELAAERLLHIEHDSGAYVLLSNFYAAKGKQEEAQKVRMKMRNGAVDKKAPGCSSVQIGGVGFEFVAGEKMHPQMEEICLLLEKLNRHSDY